MKKYNEKFSIINFYYNIGFMKYTIYNFIIYNITQGILKYCTIYFIYNVFKYYYKQKPN